MGCAPCLSTRRGWYSPSSTAASYLCDRWPMGPWSFLDLESHGSSPLTLYPNFLALTPAFPLPASVLLTEWLWQQRSPGTSESPQPTAVPSCANRGELHPANFQSQVQTSSRYAKGP